MKKEILNLGRALSKSELQSINGGATCIKQCENSTNQQLNCYGSSCNVYDDHCTYVDHEDGRKKYIYCNNIDATPF